VDWLKSQWNFAGRFVFLYSGQLITRKGVDSLLVAYREVARQRTNTSLLILGDGPELADLEKQAEEIQTGQIVFAGHQPQEILPSYFACANAFVFPSRHDGWGVVINEAAAAGLPLIATYETGAAHDLILEGHNGFCCQADDVGAFADRMLWMIDNRQELSRMGEYSQELAGACSAEVGAAQFSEMLREVVR
jgi:glycosyltransferase involved in cell wall biosynthesis